MTEIERYYNALIDSILVLSLSYEDQKKSFPDFVDLPFEVIDDFDKTFNLLPELIENNKLSLKAIADIIRLKNNLEFTLSKPIFLELDDIKFKEHEDWNRIRDLSRNVLNIIRESH